MTDELQPNFDDMVAHLRFLFDGIDPDALIEICWTAVTDKRPKLANARLYKADQIEAAAAEALVQNKRGSNVYVGACPRKPNTAPFARAGDRDVLGVQTLWCDWDVPGTAENAKHLWTPLPPSLQVVTGIHPHGRLHGWWRLDQLLTDMARARAVLSAMADEMNGDPTVCNVGRVMRLAGTIAWPLKEGRVAELTHIRAMRQPGKPTHSIDELERRFATSTTAKEVISQGLVRASLDLQASGAAPLNSLGLTLGVVDDGREKYMLNTVLACLREYIGEHGTTPDVEELFAAAWPQYAEHVDFTRPGRREDEMLEKCQAAVRRFNEGRIEGLRDLDEAIATHRAKKLNGHSTPEPLVNLPPATSFNFLQLREEVVEEEPDYIEPDFASAGDFVLLAGPPKSMKTWLLQEMLVSCATGSSFLGHAFRIPKPLKVFCLQSEMKPKILRKRARTFGAPSDEHRQLLQANLIISDRFRTILNPNGVQKAVELIKQAFPDVPPDVIAIDPLQNVFDDENESDNAQMMAFLANRIEMVRQLVNPDALVIMVHHTKKVALDEMERDPFACIRGATALRGYYDSAIVIYRASEEGKARKVHFELRAGVEVEPMLVELHNGRFQRADVLGAIDKATAIKILADIKQAWEKGHPLANTWQSKTQGRYAPRIFAKKYGVPAKQVELLILQWIDNEIVVTTARASRRHPAGLQVIGSLE